MSTTRIMPAIAALALIALTGCGQATDAASTVESAAPTETVEAAPVASASPESFTVTSEDLQDDGVWDVSIIGSSNTRCDGPGESVQVSWTEAPYGTESFAIIFENDTRSFVYWLLYDIETTSPGAEHDGAHKVRGTNGTNAIGLNYAVAPCPEVAETHDVSLTVMALDTVLDQGGLTKSQFEEAVLDHVLAEDTITGTVSGPDSN